MRFNRQGDPFNYAYSVEADPNVNSTRLEQAKSEASDGQDVVGVYKVLLPDGNLQTVTYTAGPDGYRANVRYAKVDEPVRVRSPAEKSRGRAPDEHADANRVHPLSHTSHGDDDSSELARTQFRQRSNRIRAEKHRASHADLGNDAVSGSRGSSDSGRSRPGAKPTTRRFDRIRHARAESD